MAARKKPKQVARPRTRRQSLGRKKSNGEGLQQQLNEALARQAATAEILRVISRSQTETKAVFEAISDSTKRLFGAWSTAVFSFDGEQLHLEATHGALPDSAQFLRQQYPRRPAPEFSLADRSVLENAEFQIADAWSDPNPIYSERAKARGYRSLLAVPMLRNGVSIGVIAVSRKEAGGFTVPEAELLKTFADQAVIAIENVRLFNETQDALDQQTATAEILRVISSSPTDVQPVFDAIVRSALKLVGGLSALMNRVVGDTLVLGALTSVDRASDGPTLRAYPRPLSGSYMTERVIRARAPFAIEDADSKSEIAPELKEMARTRGWRSCLCVPMLRDGNTIGTIFVTRSNPGKFSDKEVGLLSTFASQAVIAIENVRMFNETRALEQERLARLKSFFSPQLAELLAAGKGEELLKTHRREITVQFFDLRGFTAFTGAAEPEEVMELLRDFHGALGKLVMENEGTIERFAGDSVMVFFNDPLPVERPAERAVQSALAIMRAFEPIAALWKKRGHDLGLGAGIAQGYATLGAIGFEGRRDYAAIGPVTNLAARLCAEAKGGQILTDLKTSAALEGVFNFDALAPLSLKGFAQPVPAFALRREN
jgi:class 3 adenylate cyclase/putative methionine-R-sulfoxide reductase with GAF domain